MPERRFCPPKGWAAGISLVSLLCTAACTSDSPPSGAGRTTAAAPPAVQEPTSPFDDVPGLGQGRAAALRDDTIAYWQAFRRDREIERCMAQAGYVWHAEAQYPGSDVVDIVRGLELSVPRSTTPEPEALNKAYEQGLTSGRRDGYLRALYGVSAAEFDHAARHDGEVPPGVKVPGEFAEGGCTGRAEKSLGGSIWDLRRRLAGPLVRLRERARATPQFEVGRIRYQECVRNLSGIEVDSPAHVGALAETGRADARVLLDAAGECDGLWALASQAGVEALASDFRREHSRELAQQQAEYGDLLPVIRQDSQFVEFARAAAARSLRAVTAEAAP